MCRTKAREQASFVITRASWLNSSLFVFYSSRYPVRAGEPEVTDVTMRTSMKAA